ncbi:GBF-interacting protein 1-like isoform X1 [Helianthus annuus]|uniref:Putative UBA-like, GBF-interacting protein 1 n=1 Tax=Helianthus annuus TaxID=4232 RepID=A0A251S6F9_HELAN|nr:GBF-interacting protein 1-like isoform X1 [Helianthus annuus]
MGSRGSNGDGIPPASRKMVLSLKEIVDGVTDAEIYSTLKDCNMDPNEAVNRLLSQDHFHEVKSKREKKKVKNTTESRPRGGGNASNRGARSGHSGPTHYNSSESSGFQAKPTYKRENTRVAPRDASWQPPTYSDSVGYKSESTTVTATDGASFSQPASGYQPAWLGGPGQKSMADIVKMGRPQTNDYYTSSNPSQQSISHSVVVPEKQPEYDHVSPDDDWPVDQPQDESGLTSGQSNYQTNEVFDHETNEVEAQDESSDEDEIENHVDPASVTEPVYDNGPYEHNDVEEVDASLSSVSANIQKLSVQEEEHTVQPEEDAPSLIIPSHLQVNTADCSHLSFGSFSANINLNTDFSRPSTADHSEPINHEYYDDGPTRNITGAESYELPSPSQTSVLKQEDPEVTHGGQSQFGFPQPSHTHTFEVTRGSESQISTPFLNDMQAAANGNPIRESDLSYSQFSVSQSMPSRYADSASSISDPTISMAEALKNVGLSSSQPPQQTLATGPAGPQHLNVHPYSQPTLPLGLFSNMIGYPFLPQNYAYMPSGFQPTFAGNNTYHQQLAAMLPQYKNSVSVSSLPQSAAVASGYGSYGNSTAIPGNYQVTPPAGPTGSTMSYDELLNAHYKDNSHLLSLQQNENSPMWVHGGGSRTMPAVPASAFYNLQQNQNQQQPSGFRQGQQPSQSYGGAVLNYPDFFQSQTGMSQEHQLQQNPRDGGSQGQPKLQSQQLWQNGY